MVYKYTFHVLLKLNVTETSITNKMYKCIVLSFRMGWCFLIEEFLFFITFFFFDVWNGIIVVVGISTNRFLHLNFKSNKNNFFLWICYYLKHNDCEMMVDYLMIVVMSTDWKVELYLGDLLTSIIFKWFRKKK